MSDLRRLLAGSEALESWPRFVVLLDGLLAGNTLPRRLRCRQNEPAVSAESPGRCSGFGGYGAGAALTRRVKHGSRGGRRRRVTPVKAGSGRFLPRDVGRHRRDAKSPEPAAGSLVGECSSGRAKDTRGRSQFSCPQPRRTASRGSRINGTVRTATVWASHDTSPPVFSLADSALAQGSIPPPLVPLQTHGQHHRLRRKWSSRSRSRRPKPRDIAAGWSGAGHRRWSVGGWGWSAITSGREILCPMNRRC